jgi:predicted signal transduction protein with EAL and GGDEF domain
MWRVLLSGENWRGEIINRRKDGSLYHEELNIASVKNSVGEITHFVGIKEDISERKNFEERLQKLASTDSLTGLFNRRVFMERLEQEIARYHRIGSCDRPLS